MSKDKKKNLHLMVAIQNINIFIIHYNYSTESIVMYFLVLKHSSYFLRIPLLVENRQCGKTPSIDLSSSGLQSLFVFSSIDNKTRGTPFFLVD